MKLSDVLHCRIEEVVKNLLKVTKGDTAQLVKFKVLRTKRIIETYFVWNEYEELKQIIFTFKNIKDYCGLDIEYELDKEAVKRSKEKRKELESRVTVITNCYGQERKWIDREEAKKYYLDCMRNSEGSERDRYVTIYLKLMDGLKYCSDE